MSIDSDYIGFRQPKVKRATHTQSITIFIVSVHAWNDGIWPSMPDQHASTKEVKLNFNTSTDRRVVSYSYMRVWYTKNKIWSLRSTDLERRINDKNNIVTIGKDNQTLANFSTVYMFNAWFEARRKIVILKQNESNSSKWEPFPGRETIFCVFNMFMSCFKTFLK